MANKPLEQWIEQFDKGAFESADVQTQIAAGWYDWFCKDTSLASKTKSLGKKVKQIAKSAKVDPKKHYVFFKNNCPLYGRLYDDFRICDLETGDVIWTIIPSSGFDNKKGQAEVWGKENGFDGPLLEGKWPDVKKFFGV